MFWDIALAVLAAIAQGVTGWLGWSVTMDGVQQNRQKLYKGLFAVASIVGIASVGVTAYRAATVNENASSQLHARFRASTLNFEPLKDSGDSSPILPNHPIGALVRLVNIGGLPANEIKATCQLTVSPVLSEADENALFEKAQEIPALPSKNEVVQGDSIDVFCFTAKNVTVSEEQYRGLIQRDVNPQKQVVYVTVVAKFTDRIGEAPVYELCGHVFAGYWKEMVYCYDHKH